MKDTKEEEKNSGPAISVETPEGTPGEEGGFQMFGDDYRK